MKVLAFILFILSFCCFVFGQNVQKLNLRNSCELMYLVKKFNPKEHRLDSMHIDIGENDWYFIDKIDGKNIYGTDGETPYSELLWMKIRIDDRLIRLRTSKMYNPSSTGIIGENQIEIRKKPYGYKVFMWFSDGAGGYVAHWEVRDLKSKRVLLSRDEKYYNFENF